MSKQTKQRTIRLSDDLYEKAINNAKDIGLDFSSYIRYLIQKDSKQKS